MKHHCQVQLYSNVIWPGRDFNTIRDMWHFCGGVRENILVIRLTVRTLSPNAVSFSITFSTFLLPFLPFFQVFLCLQCFHLPQELF